MIDCSFSQKLQTGQGYDAYDLVRCGVLPYRSCSDNFKWDLGEFDQKGTVATRWGTKRELERAVAVAKQRGIDVIIDAVLNVCHAGSAAVPARPNLDRSIRFAPTREKDSWLPQWTLTIG